MQLSKFDERNQHADKISLAPGRYSARDLRNLAVIALLCCIVAYLRWLKLDTLVWNDPGRWLFEGQRVAAGEVPYRDFSWFYPPLAILLLGWTMKMFGTYFAVAQLFVDVISVALVFLAYGLIRLILPRFLHPPVMVCLLAIGGTSQTFFSLFSLFIYVPALQLAAAGLLLLLIGLISYVQTGQWKIGTWLLAGAGAFLAAFTKPETLLATYATLGVLAVVDRNYWFSGRKTSDWLWHYAKVAAVCIGPVLIAYLWMAKIVGFRNLWLGVTSFGLASTACPWWPTGIGLFSVAAALGEAGFLAAVLSLVRRDQFAKRFGRAYRYALIGGVAGACLYVVYVVYRNWELLTGTRSVIDKIWYSAPSTLWSGAVLLPVMWSSILLWLWLMLRWAAGRGRSISGNSITLLVLLSGPVAMTTRGWFNWHFDVTSTVPAICFPFFILLGPYLMWRMLAAVGPGFDLDRGPRGAPGAALITILLAYALVRVIAGYPSQLSNRGYSTLATLAGDIRLSDFAVNSEIYRFVSENSGPDDYVLDIPYGGGMNVATHRPSPLFFTMLEDLSMPDDFLERDLERIRAHPPKIVIAENRPNYGVYYGLEGCVCAYPRLVWYPPSSSIVAGKVFPAIRYIQQNYRVLKTVGPKLLLAPK